jgi:hypothetical protein
MATLVPEREHFLDFHPRACLLHSNMVGSPLFQVQCFIDS